MKTINLISLCPYGDRYQLIIRDWRSDTLPTTTVVLQEEQLRDIRYMIDRALAEQSQ